MIDGCSDGTFEIAEDWLIECIICGYRCRVDRHTLNVTVSDHGDRVEHYFYGETKCKHCGERLFYRVKVYGDKHGQFLYEDHECDDVDFVRPPVIRSLRSKERSYSSEAYKENSNTSQRNTILIHHDNYGGINMAEQYIINPHHSVVANGLQFISNEQIVEAILFCNSAIRSLDEQTKQFDINIFEALGMRNLSGIVGEYFAKSVQRFSNDCLHSNLHQDGYPDLLLTATPEQKEYFSTLYTIENGKKYPRDKALFSPYRYGGIEVKATCGSTPPASRIPKPLIGENRIGLVTTFDWKAHHRETNNLLAILWDFIDEVPTIAACFYRNDLTVDDWGEIVQPHEGGGRTTSVSIMNSTGIKKMCRGWIAVIDRPEYIEKLSGRKWIGYRVTE